MTREDILTAIRGTAAKNGGVPLGAKTFTRETGIDTADWFGKFWRNWGEAVREAGFEPNSRTAKIADEDMLSAYCALARQIGRAPTKGDLRIQKRSNDQLPAEKTLVTRFGSLPAVRRAAHAFATERPEMADVADLLKSSANVTTADPSSSGPTGFVYMVKHGSRPEYKIGKTLKPVRREGELRVQLPEQLRPVHYIATDDPSGVEAYWHNRFAPKRKEGEWFALSAQDVAAFKKWKRIS
jgi:hypothetical protein